MCGCADSGQAKAAQAHIAAAGVTVRRDLVKLEWLQPEPGIELPVLGSETRTRYRFIESQPMQFVKRRDVPALLEQYVGVLGIIDGDAYAALQRAG